MELANHPVRPWMIDSVAELMDKCEMPWRDERRKWWPISAHCNMRHNLLHRDSVERIQICVKQIQSLPGIYQRIDNNYWRCIEFHLFFWNHWNTCKKHVIKRAQSQQSKLHLFDLSAIKLDKDGIVRKRVYGTLISNSLPKWPRLTKTQFNTPFGNGLNTTVLVITHLRHSCHIV